MLVNLLENQSNHTQITLDSPVKSNFQSIKNNFSFIELLGNSQSVEKGFFEKKKQNSFSSHKNFIEKNRNEPKQEIPQKVDTSLEKNRTEDNKETLNSLKEKDKQQLKENKNINQEPDEKKTEKKKDIKNIEEEQGEKKKVKKKKIVEISFLELENFKNGKKVKIPKEMEKSNSLTSLEKDEKNEILEKKQKIEINFEKQIKKPEILVEKSPNIDKNLISKEQTTDEIVSQIIKEKIEFDKEKVVNHQDLKKKIEVENDLSADTKNIESVGDKKTSSEKENLTNEKTKNSPIISLRENLDLKNDKLESKNIKVSPNTENINSEKSENLGNFKEFNQKQENQSQQKDFFFNATNQKTNIKSEQVAKELSNQNFSAKDLKSNFKELIQSAKINILGKGKTTAEIQMNPKELGKMSLKISMNDKQIQGILTVDSETVKNRLSMELNSLKQDLKVAGFSLDFLNIDLKGENEKRNQFAQFFQEEMNKNLREDYKNQEISLQKEEEIQKNFSSKKVDIKA